MILQVKLNGSAELRMIVSTYQVLDRMNEIFEVTLPPHVSEFLSKVSFVNFDFMYVIQSLCVMKPDYISKYFSSILVFSEIVLALYILYRFFGNKYLSAMFTFAFFIFTALSRSSFAFFNCYEVAEGLSFLKSDYSIKCEDRRYNTGFYVASIVILLLVGYVFLIFFLLFRCRNRILDKDKRIWTQYKFFLQDYNPQFFYFECVDMV